MIASLPRLIFILPNLLGGGAERVCLTLLWELAERNYPITLFLFKREGVYWNEVHPNIQVVSALQHGERTSRNFFKVLYSLIREVRRQDIVVGALEGWPTFLGYWAARFAGKPCVGWVHTDLANNPLYRNGRVVKQLATYVYPRLNEVVFVSDGARASTAEWLGQAKKRGWIVIYNCVRDIAASQGYTASEGKENVVLAIGRLSIHKGFDLLLQAHAQLLKEGIWHRLIIVGEGEDRKMLEEMAKELHVEKTFSMPGFFSDIDRWYAQADVFVLSSRFEGFGLVLVEAMAHGVPVVATDCPSGPREILADGVYGELIPAGSVEALAEGIRYLLTDTAYRKRLSEQGRQRASEFIVPCIADHWAAIFNTLLLRECSDY